MCSVKNKSQNNRYYSRLFCSSLEQLEKILNEKYEKNENIIMSDDTEYMMFLNFPKKTLPTTLVLLAKHLKNFAKPP